LSKKGPKRGVSSLEAAAEAEEDEGQILGLDTSFDLSAFGSERGDEAAPAVPALAKDEQAPRAAVPTAAGPAPPERTRDNGSAWPPTPVSHVAAGPLSSPSAPPLAGPEIPPPMAVAEAVPLSRPIPPPPNVRGAATPLIVERLAPGLEASTRSLPPPAPAATVPEGAGALAGHPGILREAPPGAAPPVAVEARRGRWPLLAAAALLLVAVLMTAGLRTPRPMTALLAPSATGDLTVESTPAGASVIIEGKDRGRTPLSLKLPPGSYDVELRSGKERHVVAARVTAGAMSAQHVVLRSGASSRGQLRVTSDPPSAMVTVDGRHRGRTPLLVTGLAAGQHEVVVTGPAGPRKERVQVDADTTTLLAVPLVRGTRPPPPAAVGGWVAVRSPVVLQVYEGERLLGNASVDRLMLKSGTHTLRFVNQAAGVNVSRRVTIEPGETARVEVAVPMGMLSVNASPWAAVSIDRREVGETPLGNLELPAGPHEVVFRHPEFGERRQHITLRAGITTRLSVDMRR
jgi:PEGA domain